MPAKASISDTHERIVPLPKLESGLRTAASAYIYLIEAALHIGVGILLSGAAAVATFEAGAVLWRGTIHSKLSNGLLVLDQLLLVLMLVEILHTVRISIRSEELVLLEPFLIVGLIASIRRVLVITLKAATLAEGGGATAEAAISFRNAMIELALLAFLILALVFSIYLLKRVSAVTVPVG
jgi:hypothetical protein